MYLNKSGDESPAAGKKNTCNPENFCNMLVNGEIIEEDSESNFEERAGEALGQLLKNHRRIISETNNYQSYFLKLYEKLLC
jgi:hypothetical protein